MFSANIQFTVEQRKKDLEEIKEYQILKGKLEALFDKQKSNRIGFLTIVCRDEVLTNEKNTLIDKTIKAIKEFQGTKDDLIDLLEQHKIDNGKISVKAKKYHYNLTRGPDDPDYNKVLEGELSRKSGLAEIYNQAIEIVKEYRLHNDKEIRNNFLTP